MSPSSAASDLERLAEDLPLPKDERIALDVALKAARALDVTHGLADLDEVARDLAERYGAKFPSVGRKIAELRVKLLKAMGDLRRKRT